MEITECAGYKKITASINSMVDKGMMSRERLEKSLNFALKMAKHYEDVTGVEASVFLDKWEENRRINVPNFYQRGYVPRLDGMRVRVFETAVELDEAIGKQGFRCPACNGITHNPYECEAGLDLPKGEICNWKVYGLLRDLGKGIFVFVKSELRGNLIFMPVAWENEFSGVPNE